MEILAWISNYIHIKMMGMQTWKKTWLICIGWWTFTFLAKFVSRSKTRYLPLPNSSGQVKLLVRQVKLKFFSKSYITCIEKWWHRAWNVLRMTQTVPDSLFFVFIFGLYLPGMLLWPSGNLMNYITTKNRDITEHCQVEYNHIHSL